MGKDCELLWDISHLQLYIQRQNEETWPICGLGQAQRQQATLMGHPPEKGSFNIMWANSPRIRYQNCYSQTKMCILHQQKPSIYHISHSNTVPFWSSIEVHILAFHITITLSRIFVTCHQRTLSSTRLLRVQGCD